MIGVVADDITGAGDIGIMFAKADYAAHIYSFTAGAAEFPQVKDADIVILDTNSRFDPPKTAYDKVFAASNWLQQQGCTQYLNKTCSVFRGNIGAEFDAMIDALGESFAVVVLGFPKNGRTTVDGIHFVHGRKLEDSEFRDDPVHPMTRSDLAGILRQQTRRTVAELRRSVVEQGAEALRQAVSASKDKCNYLIIDVVDQQALRVIAEAVQEEPVLCGSSALSEELALLHRENSLPKAKPAVIPARSDAGLLITAGSLMPQTAAQIAEIQASGVPVLELDTLKLLEPENREPLLTSLTEEIVRRNRSGEHVVLHSSHDAGQVQQTKAAGLQRGLSNTDVSRFVSGSLAEITARVLAATGQRRAVIAGGDTSAAVCERLGIQGMRIIREIEPGLPSCLTFGEQPLLLVLKSGSFGKPDFFQQAIHHLLTL
jgi:uncharacterized protein YgbK (DUF1537 family)